MRARTRVLLAASVALLLGAIALPAQAAPAKPPQHSPVTCGSQDTPETGIAGDVTKADQDGSRAAKGYNCGLAVVGHNGFDGELSSSLAWSASCAYVQGRGGGVRVVDMSNPTRPAVVKTLPTGGSSENLHAVTTPERALLTAARGKAVVDVYDVRTCTNPVLLGTVNFINPSTGVGIPGGPAHNIEFNPDGTKLYGSFPVQVADISNLADPATWTVRDFSCQLASQFHILHKLVPPTTVNLCEHFTLPPMMAHEFEFNADGSRMYIGGQLDPFGDNYIHVVDVTVWPPKLISSAPGAGHGIRRATIGGKPYLLHSDETISPLTALSGLTGGALSRDSAGGLPAIPGLPPLGTLGQNLLANGCVPDLLTPNGGAAESHLTSIEDEAHPKTVSELELAINDPANCLAQVRSQVNSTVHYNTVDDPDDTTFAMLSMKNAGLRVWDIRNPAAPKEAAYFNPGQFTAANGTKSLDIVRMHTVYNKATGHIWLLSVSGGLWVLELEPQVRSGLGLAALPTSYPNGRPARPAAPSTANPAVAVRSVSLSALTSGYYCQL